MTHRSTVTTHTNPMRRSRDSSRPAPYDTHDNSSEITQEASFGNAADGEFDLALDEELDDAFSYAFNFRPNTVCRNTLPDWHDDLTETAMPLTATGHVADADSLETTLEANTLELVSAPSFVGDVNDGDTGDREVVHEDDFEECLENDSKDNSSNNDDRDTDDDTTDELAKVIPNVGMNSSQALALFGSPLGESATGSPCPPPSRASETQKPVFSDPPNASVRSTTRFDNEENEEDGKEDPSVSETTRQCVSTATPKLSQPLDIVYSVNAFGRMESHERIVSVAKLPTHGSKETALSVLQTTKHASSVVQDDRSRRVKLCFSVVAGGFAILTCSAVVSFVAIVAFGKMHNPSSIHKPVSSVARVPPIVPEAEPDAALSEPP